MSSHSEQRQPLSIPFVLLSATAPNYMRYFHLCLIIALSGACSAQYPGALDTTYRAHDLGNALGDGTDQKVFCAAMRPDGRMLLGGQFQNVNGGYQRMLGSLNVDGTRDTSFVPTDLPSTWSPKIVHRMALQPDGMLLVAGRFNRCIHRMQVSGKVDSTFITGAGCEGGSPPEGLALALQPDGKVLIGGRFTSFNGTPVVNLVRLNANGTLDATFNTGSGLNGDVTGLALQLDGKIVVVGRFTNCWGSAGRMVRLNGNGTLDPTFQASPGADNDILNVLLRADGSLLIHGAFYTVNGTSAPYFCRITSTGSVDPAFVPDPGVANFSIRTITEQADQRLLLATNYSAARLMSDGTLDTTFHAPVLSQEPSYTRTIEVLQQWPDGRIFIGGAFVSVDGTSANNVALLNADGSLDASFNTPYGFNNVVMALSVLADGSVVVNGVFNGIDGTPTNTYNQLFSGSVARLTPEGEVDTAFTPYGAFGLHPSQAIQPDGKIVVGAFRIARLNADGTLDAAFPNGPLPYNDLIYDIEVQPDGKILLCGHLSGFGGVSSQGLVRLNDDGTVDASLNVGTGFPMTTNVQSMALQPDGRIVLAGGFTSYNGTPVNYFCRVMPDGALDTSFHIGTGPNSTTRLVELFPDGRILVGGSFTYFNGAPAKTLVLLHPNGSIDTTFVNETSVLLPDGGPLLRYDPIGKILYGTYTMPGYLMRLNLDGSVDPTFDIGSGANSLIRDLIVQPDTTYLIGGGFTSYDGVGRNRIARIHGGHSEKTVVNVKAFLGGPYIGGFMSYSYYLQGTLPLTEPYSAMGYPHTSGGGGESIASLPYPQIVTDWVVVELRDALDPSTVVATQSALLRRDGQVLSTRFLKNLVFDVPHGNYHVAVHHRNHLGVMTAGAIDLDDMPSHVDFTELGAPTFGIDAQKLVGSRMVLWVGDANGNGILKYAGYANDRDAILLAIGGVNPLNTVSGYLREDVNLDGVVSYVGTNNDRDALLLNLPGSVVTATRTEQVP